MAESDEEPWFNDDDDIFDVLVYDSQGQGDTNGSVANSNSPAQNGCTGGGGDQAQASTSSLNQEARKQWQRILSRPKTSNVAPAPAVPITPSSNGDSFPSLGLAVPPSGEMVPLISTDIIPGRFRSIFQDYEYFNVMQSSVLPAILNHERRPSVAVCAPTGTGKTVLFELAIIRLLADNEAAFTGRPFTEKIIYLAPLKSLCSERLNDWNKKFTKFGLSVIEVTGDSTFEEQAKVHKAHIIVSTPEKWDAITRRWKDHNLQIMKDTRLMCIDEVHILSEEGRGAALEAIVSRVKTANISHQTTTRFIAVSATAPNIEDVAQWLGTSENPGLFFKLDDECRPVKVSTHVRGIPCYANTNGFVLDNKTNREIRPIVEQFGEGKPSLVFCMTRKSTERACKELADSYPYPREEITNFQHASFNLKDVKLAEYVRKGVAFHHAGLDHGDRRIIEKLFLDGLIFVLFSTSTLSMGVNLPAHLVIIKGTYKCVNGTSVQMTETDIMQMIGRAGRPQFDTTAFAVILCAESDVQKYDNLVKGQRILESFLHKNLPEHLNSEVVCRTICSLQMALDWLKSTFFYIRCMKNRQRYNIPPESDRAETRLKNICEAELNGLKKYGLTEMDSEDIIEPTEAGKLMAHYCLSFETMRAFHGIEPKTFLKDLLFLISSTKEMKSEISLRHDEDKKYLYQFHNHKSGFPTVKFANKDKIKTVEDKIYTLIQIEFGGFSHDKELELGRYLTEIRKLIQIGNRVSKCLFEYLSLTSICSEKGGHNLRNAFLLMRSFVKGIWHDSVYVVRQLEGVGPVLSTQLVRGLDITSFSKLEEIDPTRIYNVVGNRVQPATLINTAKCLPKYSIQVRQTKKSPSSAAVKVGIFIPNAKEILEVLSTLPGEAGGKRTRGGSGTGVRNILGTNHASILTITNSDDMVLLHRTVIDRVIYNSPNNLTLINFDLKFEKPKNPPYGKLKLTLLSNFWIGIDVTKEFTVEFPEYGDEGDDDNNDDDTFGPSIGVDTEITPDIPPPSEENGEDVARGEVVSSTSDVVADLGENPFSDIISSPKKNKRPSAGKKPPPKKPTTSSMNRRGINIFPDEQESGEPLASSSASTSLGAESSSVPSSVKEEKPNPTCISPRPVAAVNPLDNMVRRSTIRENVISSVPALIKNGDDVVDFSISGRYGNLPQQSVNQTPSTDRRVTFDDTPTVFTITPTRSRDSSSQSPLQPVSTRVSTPHRTPLAATQRFGTLSLATASQRQTPRSTPLLFGTPSQTIPSFLQNDEFVQSLVRGESVVSSQTPVSQRRYYISPPSTQTSTDANPIPTPSHRVPRDPSFRLSDPSYIGYSNSQSFSSGQYYGGGYSNYQPSSTVFSGFGARQGFGFAGQPLSQPRSIPSPADLARSGVFNAPPPSSLSEQRLQQIQQRSQQQQASRRRFWRQY